VPHKFYQDFDFQIPRAVLFYTFSAARSFALRERGLTAISSSDAVTGFRVNIVSTGWSGVSGIILFPEGIDCADAARKAYFTKRSSNEW
jgi:hypothetical protein